MVLFAGDLLWFGMKITKCRGGSLISYYSMMQSVSGCCCCCCFFVVLFLLFQFLFVCLFVCFSQNVTPLMETTLNSGLSFIKHVDCGRGVSKDAH